jgi:hypothetical protein
VGILGVACRHRVVRSTITMKERFLEVLPSSRGDVVSWWAFRRGKFEPPGFLGRSIGLTTALTDAVVTMWDVCQELDPSCERTVIVPNGFTSSYFRIEFQAERFTVTVERKLVRGAFPVNPLAAEIGKNYEIVFHLCAEEEPILQQICDLFRAKSSGAKILQEAWL